MLVAYVELASFLSAEFKVNLPAVSNPFWFYNLNITFELILISLYLKHPYASAAKVRLFYFTFLICVALGITLAVLKGVDGFLNEWLVFNNLYYTFWILMLVHDIYRQEEKKSTHHLPDFLYLAALFFYVSCSIPTFALYDYIGWEGDTVVNDLWSIHDFLNPTMYFLIAIGFILEGKKRKTPIIA